MTGRQNPDPRVPQRDEPHAAGPRKDDVDDKVFPAYQAGAGMAVPPQALGIDPSVEARAVNATRPSEPTEEDEWHMPDEDREKAIENARQRETD